MPGAPANDLDHDLPGVEVGPYRPGEEGAIIECMRACFGVAPELARWRHLHLDNPAGHSLIVLARTGDVVVAHFATLRRRLRAFGEEVNGAHVLDTMTHPDWQRRGLYGLVASASERLGREHGVAATYGVTNEAARHGAVKYEGRHLLGPFPVMVRPVRPLAAGLALARYGLGGVPTPVAIPDCGAAGPLTDPDSTAALVRAGGDAWRLPRFDAGHTQLFAAAEGLPPLGFVRDAAYLRWRYGALPSTPYRQRDVIVDGKVAATAIVRIAPLAGLRFLFVMDWHWRTGARDSGTAVARAVIRLAQRAQVHGIAALATRGTMHRRTLGRLGFLAIPAPLFPKSAWPGVRPEGRYAEDLRWLDARNWYFTWGDGLIL